ncbi:acyl-CoA dehydrogenase [Pseudonocardia ailaonensis]|uniref:Acyl-CoA dehydrogenase n=1 Tax=Pseudonocardia ailaonensis TaxID=367279 RepID=A0ABN2NGT8_9PSEU
MRDSWPQEIADLREVVARLADQRIRPMVQEIDAAGVFSTELMGILRDQGLTALPVPEEFGGCTTDLRSFVTVMEELSRVFPTASTMLTPHWFSTKQIVRWGHAGWVEPLLREVADGRRVGALALTEPEAGSDLGGLTTRATKDGDDWVVDGGKRFITNAGHCDYYVVLARTGEKGPRGISMFYVEADSPGLTVGRYEHKMGLRASATGEVHLDQVRIPGDHLLGTVGKGFAQMAEGLLEGRAIVAGLAVGIAQGALDQAVEYAKVRKQFGRPIGSFQGLQFLLADMAIRTETARSITYDAVDALLAGRPDANRLVSIAKTHATDAAMAVATDAVQVLGGSGYVTDFPVEMLMRDAKIQQIYEGTNEIQRVLIARDLLGDVARG